MNKSEMNEYNFGEQLQEGDKKVYITDKYWASKEKTIELIKQDFGLNVADFWIMKTLSKNKDYVIYNGLIISHNGCLKINDKLGDNGFNPAYLSEPIEFEYNGIKGLKQIYKDDKMYEVGEINSENLKKNPYPFAMLFKRVFDRVVLKKSKIAFYGVYSEEEADEFKENKADVIAEQTEANRKFNKKISQIFDEPIEANEN